LGNPQNVDVINVVSILKLKSTEQPLSKFTTDFKYLWPETKENSFFYLLGIDHIDSCYMILHDKTTQLRYLYKTSGELIGQIGEKGSGPGEYIGVTDVFLWGNLQEIHLYNSNQKKILRFGLDLKYLGSIKLENSPAAMERFNDKYYICAFTETVWTRKDKHDLYLKDPINFNDVKILLDNKKSDKQTQIKGLSNLRWLLSKSDTIFYARETDTRIEVFKIADETPELKYVLDLNEFYSNPRNPASSFVRDLMFFDKYLMITVQSAGQIYTGYYDTEIKKLENFSIINDLDMGLEFYPMGNTGDGGYHSDDLKIQDFINQWDSKNEKDQEMDFTCKYPERARWLKDTISRSIEANSLIMVIYNRN